MKLPTGPWTILAFLVPSLIPLAVSLRLDVATLTEMALILAATAALLFVQRRGHRLAFAADKRSDDVLRAAALLEDYERDGRGWFWETDRHGILRYITPQVAERVGLASDEVLGKQFNSLISQIGKRDDEREERTLGFHLSSRTAFGDISIKVAADEGALVVCFGQSGAR